MMRACSWLLLAAFFLACGGGGGERSLQVSVRTDFAPLIDFSSVRVELDDEAFETLQVRPEQDFIRGVAVANFDELQAGTVRVRASLIAPSGAPLLDRLVEARVSGPTTITVTLTRSCLNVECPGAGNPAATECDNGRCVVPGCSPQRPELCDDSVCLSPAECPEVLESCGEVACIGGACLFETRDGDDGCDPGAVCVPGSGCVDQPISDLGMPDMEVPDADMGICEEGAPCEIEGAACEDGITECSTGEAVCVSVGVKEAGVP
ncbi:MAG: hypothetical protein AAF938_19080, partial [Myxococcota bacterium]